MIIVRYGEIGIKSDRTRKKIEAKLIENIKKAINSNLKIEKERGRIFVHSNSREIAEKIAKVFGVVSTSLAEVIEAGDFNSVVDFACEFAKKQLKSNDTFAVRVRRVGEHEYSSMELANAIGARIVEETKARVDLTNPSKEIFVEVRGDRAFVFSDIIRGFGGLPLSTQGKGIALLSGGIDSPVAAWLIMKRGMSIEALFFDSQPLVDRRTIERTRKVARKLAEYHNREINLYIAPYGEELLKIMKYRNKKIQCILCKRTMHKVAEKLALDLNARAIITGESLAQVASQTADNLRVINHGITLPVFRPLIGLDKVEIIELAKRIGSYEISAMQAACCLGPPLYPETRAKLNEILKAEKELEHDKMVEDIYKRITKEEIRA